MKYTEEQFKKEVESLYNKDIEVVSRFKGLSKPILVKDKYGVMSFNTAKQVLLYTPGIKAAINKTEYFMNLLKEKQEHIYNNIKPASEYSGMNSKMLFETQFGLVSVTPGNLISKGFMPTIEAAIDRKQYFYNQLKFIYGDKYDFKITETSRHGGKSILICPEHGEVSIDNDYIFMGRGCPKCKNWKCSDTLYLIRLYNEEESFYKLGISYTLENGQIRRFKEYKNLGYEIEVIKTISFENPIDCKTLETKLKRLIKNNLYLPKHWEHETSTECFSKNLLDLILDQLCMI